ncbi:MAG: flagellar export chaperone FliS [Planctomycetota bacterium]|nr:MAG: flagellar export chaperone FliS [Planctomycetota bacterium]
MSTQEINPYLRTKVLTASPEELRLMLLEGAIRFARQGRDGMARKDHEATYQGLSQAKAIIMELINALRPEVNPELCQRMTALYVFMYKRLLEANLEKSVEMIDEVIELLEYERETWVMLMDKLRQEREAEAVGLPPAAQEQEGHAAASRRLGDAEPPTQGLSFVA